jgi:hydrogenase/urease accessory protein HupE
LLSLTEIQQNNGAIQQQFDARFHVSNNGQRGEKVLTWVVPPQTDGEPTDTDYIVIMHRVNFAEVPKNPAIETDLFGTKDGEAQMTMAATHLVNGAKVREVAILEAGAPTHIFFRGGWAIFSDFVRVGLEHILGGFDHLLFLLTIVIAAAGWRYWLAVVTSFTVAHSITLALSALNIVRIPANIIEPGIAASIILMAALSLRSARVDDPRTKWSRVAIVFACGLLHGFGFAGAIGAMAVNTESRIATLAGFNVGIELGQLLFVGAVLLLIALFKRLGQIGLADQLPRLASSAAVIFGAALLFQRLEIF